MDPTSEISQTTARDTGITAKNINAEAQNFTGRDQINYNVYQRPVTAAQILKLERLQHSIDYDVRVVIAVRSALNHISKLEWRLSKGTDFERHISTLLVIVENLLDELAKLDNLIMTDKEAMGTHSSTRLTIVKERTLLSNLDHQSDALSYLTDDVKKAETRGVLRQQFSNVVEDLTNKLDQLRSEIIMIGDQSADDARKQIIVLEGVIEELRHEDLVEESPTDFHSKLALSQISLQTRAKVSKNTKASVSNEGLRYRDLGETNYE